jgi:cell division protein FtsZ
MINLRIQAPEVQRLSPKIIVVGVGGAGGNAVNNMISSGLEGVEFVVCNTDAQALEGSLCENRIQLGSHVTGGLGAGAKPEMGQKAAEESIEEVMEYLLGANMVFITAGMGGGTGTGAAPIISRACRDSGILTVGVVTKPFTFEGSHRMRQAESGIGLMQDVVDTLIVIPNQNLFRVANERTTFAEAFRMADSVLQSGVRGVTDLITKEGLINLDFSDIRSAMQEMGKAMMGTGEAEGERRAIEAAEAAINNPLLDDISMKGARGVIINVTGGADMTLFEVDEACTRIRDEVDPNANIIFGSTFDDKMEGRMRVSVVATGIDAAEQKQSGTNAGGGARVATAGKPAQPEEQPLVYKRARPQGMGLQNPGLATRAAIPQRPAQATMQQPQAPLQQQQPVRTFADEPERDMFEQQELMAQQAPISQPMIADLQRPAVRGYAYAAPVQQQTSQAAGLRGTIQDGSFIPPRAIEPEPQMPVSAYGGAYAPQPQQHQPVQQRGYNLQPPVPGANQGERKKSPSLFERITSGVRRDHSRQEEGSDDIYGGNGGGQAAASGGGFHMRAAPRLSEAPAQGQLNIDAPAAAPRSREDELDIPAFLRRQAS